jgi:hypothetical protein
MADVTSQGVLSAVARKSVAGGAAPSFEKVHEEYVQATSGATYALTVASNIPVGNMAIIVGTAEDISSIADDSGNTWSEIINYTVGIDVRIWAAPITTQLNTSDNVTITWTGSSFSQRQVSLLEINDASAAGITASANGFTTVSTATATTTNAPSIIVGASTWAGSSVTATGNNSTLAGTQTSGNDELQAFYNVEASTGSKTVGTTLSTSKTTARIWANFY